MPRVEEEKPKSTRERLVEALEQLPESDRVRRMIKRAKAGIYDEYDSPLTFPLMQLVQDAANAGHREFAQRVIHGEFDATKEEADAWMAGPEGQAALQELLTARQNKES